MSQGDTLETMKMRGAWVRMLKDFIHPAPLLHPCSSVRPHKRSDANLTRLTPARNVNANPNIVRVHPWFSLKLFEAEAQRKPKLGDHGLKDSGANSLTHSPFR
jgi:hypothetical protein